MDGWFPSCSACRAISAASVVCIIPVGYTAVEQLAVLFVSVSLHTLPSWVEFFVRFFFSSSFVRKDKTKLTSKSTNQNNAVHYVWRLCLDSGFAACFFHALHEVSTEIINRVGMASFFLQTE